MTFFRNKIEDRLEEITSIKTQEDYDALIKKFNEST